MHVEPPALYRQLAMPEPFSSPDVCKKDTFGLDQFA
jgi:hypothetical protein